MMLNREVHDRYMDEYLEVLVKNKCLRYAKDNKFNRMLAKLIEWDKNYHKILKDRGDDYSLEQNKHTSF